MRMAQRIVLVRVAVLDAGRQRFTVRVPVVLVMHMRMIVLQHQVTMVVLMTLG